MTTGCSSICRYINTVTDSIRDAVGDKAQELWDRIPGSESERQWKVAKGCGIAVCVVSTGAVLIEKYVGHWDETSDIRFAAYAFGIGADVGVGGSLILIEAGKVVQLIKRRMNYQSIA